MAIDNKESTGLGTLHPTHDNRPKAGEEHFAHKGLIVDMDGHLLIKVADMLHGISPSTIYGECWLGEPMGEPGLINPPHKRGLGNLP